jgi:hypothetical protein
MTTEVDMMTNIPQTYKPRQQRRPDQPASTASNIKPFAGTQKKSNDSIYEAKRSEYEKKVTAIESELKNLKPRLVII